MSCQVIGSNIALSVGLITTEIALQAQNNASLVSGGASMFTQIVYQVPEHLKTSLIKKLLGNDDVPNAIVYVKTNFDADALADALNRDGITAESFHGNKSQRTRTKTLNNFRTKLTKVLVATESATSDVCMSEVTTLVNYNIPVSAETYVTRIRSHHRFTGTTGKVFSLCDKCEERALANIRRVVGEAVTVLEHHSA